MKIGNWEIGRREYTSTGKLMWFVEHFVANKAMHRGVTVERLLRSPLKSMKWLMGKI